MYWYLSKEELPDIQIVQLTRDDCVEMVYTKRCGEAMMNCENEECS